jgi:hypothetical protein
LIGCCFSASSALRGRRRPLLAIGGWLGCLVAVLFDDLIEQLSSEMLSRDSLLLISSRNSVE